MQQPTKVHLIFKTHLDIGFTDYARNVVDGYFNNFIPKALETARVLREHGKRFIWTTGSWLIYEYLEQASPENRKRMEDAIALGDIVWHGLPFTTHTELMNPSLFRFGLSLSQSLDKRFGRHTIAAKMTDVPGHTRGIVPLMAEAGIRFLHIGVNPASTVPDVQPVFVWQDESGARLIVMYQRGSYGDAMIVPGLDDAIAFAHTADNIGPQSPTEALQNYREMQQRFPNAGVVASTLDAFAEKLLTIEAQLPIVTAEIGDTWMHGVGTDPKKVAQLRALLRWLNTVGAQHVSEATVPDDKLNLFQRKLILVPEHTWGMDEKTHFKDYLHYRPDQLRAILDTEQVKVFAASWAEQRAYIDEAMAALNDSPLLQSAKEALQELAPQKPVKTGYRKIQRRGFSTPNFDISFDERGAITRLVDTRTGRRWATSKHALALFRYQTFSQADYDRFYAQYVINKRQTRSWSVDDQTKPGMDAANQPSQFWQPELKSLYTQTYDDGQRFLLELRPPKEAANWGCPNEITLEIDLPDAQTELRFTLQWFEKSANRLPEALWFSFVPKITSVQGWTMDKLGKRISPLEVVRDGNRKLHAVGAGVFYQDERGKLDIETLDAPLVAPGEPSLLNFNNRQPPLRHGMHFNLYNNIWGTNFPMWYDEDARFRFVIRL